ncbi:MAG: CPBP family intramembrane glutamic endopeptidase [Campylobacter sputorum]|uniref:CPBP family intramembrane glutamic endopeptidase n=1 Tax=Campylobacter sputorum TaxID=206 RepID=UPI0019113D01|nr:CPBP family intramembrane glutamic endopeptidase [Campylobacter sputorum]ASM38438.1 hypothetical protein CSPARA_0866 [Campylobacter sputorum bv. paraureolyticus LMG 11764]MDY6120751.1 CPBP family intramembrane glutamic endopeptidase [Campylobacter sputorum]
MNKITTLRWFDILIITFIMFFLAIYSSTLQYFALSNEMVSLDENLSFSPSDNYIAILTEFFYLVLVYFYLKFRKFDFSVFTNRIKFNLKALFQGILIFIFIATIFDLYFILISCFLEPINLKADAVNLVKFNMSIILFALINGFFEEIFFLGICLFVKKEYIKFAFLYSLIIRFSFHTYQGVETAFVIGFVLGYIFYLLYGRIKNLVPFFVAHSIGDMIGVSMWFFMLLN